MSACPDQNLFILSDGAQLDIALIENTATVGTLSRSVTGHFHTDNGQLGGEIAAAYAQLVSQDHNRGSHPHVIHKPSPSSTNSEGKATAPLVSTEISSSRRLTRTDIGSQPPARLVVVGSAAVDITAQADPVPGATGASNNLHTTLPGVVSLTSGGVGRNVAEAAYRILSSYSQELSSSAILLSPIGEDAFGHLLTADTERIGMRTDGLIRVPAARTAVCNMVLDSTGGLTGGVADMDVIRALDAKKVRRP